MKAVVTGGCGFIGSHLVDRLVELGHDVKVVDDLSGGLVENLSGHAPVVSAFSCEGRLGRHRQSPAEGLPILRFSLGREEAVFQPLLRYLADFMGGTDVLYHLAADATEGRSQFTPWRCTLDGLAASAQVFAAAAAVGVKRIVFTSSMAVYGDQPAPFTEDMEPHPVDVYGVNKHAAERMLQILAETHGFEYVILRPYNVYGPRQNPMDRYRNVVTIFINRLLRGLPMQIYGDGSQERAFTWIGDVIGQIGEAGWRPEAANQIFNVGSDVSRTVWSLASTVFDAIGRSPAMEWYMPEKPGQVEMSYRGLIGGWAVEHLAVRPREVHAAYCDNSKWWRVTRQTPPDPMPLAAGIRAVIEWMKEIGPQEPPHMEMEIPSEKVPDPWRKS